MFRNRIAAAAVLTTLTLSGGLAVAAGPTFEPAIWADGRLWSTQGVTVLPAPNEPNLQSFDRLFVVVNSPVEPVPVAVQPGAKLVRIVLTESSNCGTQNCNDTFETDSYETPEGKILLVDEVSVRQIINPQTGYALLNTTDFGEFIHFTAIDELTVAAGNAFAARSMNAYARRVGVSVSFDQIPSGLVILTATITGRLIDETEEEFILCNPNCE